MTTRRVPPIMLALAIGLLAPVVASPAGGAADRDASADAKRGGTLRLHRFRDIDFVDPALAYFPDSWTILYATCAKLYNYPDRGGAAGTAVVPEVAVAYPHLSQGGKVATIQLRRGYRFHTGDPVTAANFVAAFNRDANPRMESPAAAYLHEIRGADAVLAGRARTISGVRALGRYTLRLVLTQPVGDLAARLTMPFFCPVRVNERIDPGGIDNPLGSGPYYVSSLVRNRQLVLRRNPYYRGSRPRNVDRVVSTVGGGVEACRAAIDRDEVDFCGGNGVRPTLDRADLQRHGVNRRGGRLHFSPLVATDYFAFNHARPAFRGRAQIPLKQAINYAIDRPALARVGGLLGGRRTDQFLPPTLNRPAVVYPMGGVTSASLAKANSLLAKARFKPRRLVLYAINRGGFVARAQIFQFNLRRIGIEVDIRYLDPSIFHERIGRRGEPFDIALHGWIPDYADGAAFFVPLFSGRSIRPAGNSNVAYFDRPWVNRRIDRASRLKGVARRRAWAELDVDLMRRDPPGAPFVSGARADLVSPSLGCYLLHPVVGGIDIAAACKK